MYKIMFKLFERKDGAIDDPNKDAIYVRSGNYGEDEVFTSPDLDGAESRALRGGMCSCYEEVPPRKLSGHNVIRSYFDPEYNDEATLSCRFYIIEEDD